MEVGNCADDCDRDKILFDLSRKLGNTSFDSTTISTSASLQSYDSTIFHDSFSPILGIESQIKEIYSKNQNKELTSKNKEINSHIADSKTSGDELKSLNSDKIELNEQNESSLISSFVNNSGIKTLFRSQNHHEKTIFSPLSIKVNRVLVNGVEAEVIPSVKALKNKEIDVPSGFKGCDELVKYYIGKVLRSSNSLYYIEKKLQQALYGAVFLAYELEEYNNKIICEKHEFLQESTEYFKGKSEVNDLCKNSEICYKFDKNNKVAIKVSSMSLRKRKPSLKEDIEAEVSYSQSMKGHKNVLEYSEIWQDGFKNIYIKMEFAEFEDLFEVMRRRKKPLTENEARWLFSQIFSAVIHLHNNEMAMRDLSLENILMFKREPHFFDKVEDMDFTGVIKPSDTLIIPKITDPGQACRIKAKKVQCSSNNKNVQNNLRESGFQLQKVEFLFGKSFRPPEAYSIGSLYDATKVDVFCLGWMLLYTLTKHQPFETCRLITEYDNNKNEGFINNFLGGIISNNSNKNSEYKDKKFVAKDENWSYIVNGRIDELFKKIKANRLSDQVLDLIENMLLPDYKKRFSMRNVIEHSWLKHQNNKKSILYSPIMSSSLIQTKNNRISNNIFKPSNFFENNKKKDSEKRNTNKVNITKKDPEDYSGESNRIRNTNKINDIKTSMVNNEYLNSMVKRTNEKLKMTRITIVKRQDSEIEILTTNTNKNLFAEINISNKPNLEESSDFRIPNNSFNNERLKNSKVKNKINQNRGLNEALNENNNEYSRIQYLNAKINKNKINLENNLVKLNSLAIKKNSDSNIFSDIWSFFTGGNK